MSKSYSLRSEVNPKDTQDSEDSEDESTTSQTNTNGDDQILQNTTEDPNSVSQSHEDDDDSLSRKQNNVDDNILDDVHLQKSSENAEEITTIPPLPKTPLHKTNPIKNNKQVPPNVSYRPPPFELRYRNPLQSVNTTSVTPTSSHEDAMHQERIETQKTINKLLESKRGTNLKLPNIMKTFSGKVEESVNDFFAFFDRYSKLSQVEESEKLLVLPLLLSGSALTHYESLGDTIKNDFQMTKKSLIERFSPDALKLHERALLNSKKMLPSEKLETFIDHLLTKSRDINLSETETMSIFLTNVIPNIREFCLLQKPKTLKEALDAARLKNATNPEEESTDTKLTEITKSIALLTKTIENIQTSGNQTLNAYSSPSNNWTPRQENSRDNPIHANHRLDETRLKNEIREEIMKEVKNIIPKPSGREQRTTDGRPICFRCSKVGHTARMCRVRPNTFAPRNQLNTNIPRFPTTTNTFPVRRNVDTRPSLNRNGQQTNRDATVNTFTIENDDKTVPISNAMFIKAKINSITVHILLDTGASISVIDEKFFQQLPYTKNPAISSNFPNITSVCGSSTPIAGKVL